MQRVSQNLIAQSPRGPIWGSIQHFFFTHDILRLDAEDVKWIRGCVANFILVVVYSAIVDHYDQLSKYLSQSVIEKRWKWLFIRNMLSNTDGYFFSVKTFPIAQYLRNINFTIFKSIWFQSDSFLRPSRVPSCPLNCISHDCHINPWPRCLKPGFLGFTRSLFM